MFAHKGFRQKRQVFNHFLISFKRFTELDPLQGFHVRPHPACMQLATEMNWKILVSLSQIEKSQALEFILHVADISNPAKDWELHRQWTSRVMEEFFCQVCNSTAFIISSSLFSCRGFLGCFIFRTANENFN